MEGPPHRQGACDRPAGSLDFCTYPCIFEMTRKELERKLRELGWGLARNGRRHDIWARREAELAIPRHREINENTAAAILRAAGGERS